MQDSDLISDYAKQFARALRADPVLSQRVREEVEEHLRNAAAAETGGARHDLESRAIARFGEPSPIVAEFATLALVRRISRLGLATILAICVVFAAMKGRLAWYAAIHSAGTGDFSFVSGYAGLIDRYAFWLSVMIGIGACAYGGARRLSAASWSRASLHAHRSPLPR